MAQPNTRSSAGASENSQRSVFRIASATGNSAPQNNNASVPRSAQSGNNGLIISAASTTRAIRTAHRAAAAQQQAAAAATASAAEVTTGTLSGSGSVSLPPANFTTASRLGFSNYLVPLANLAQQQQQHSNAQRSAPRAVSANGGHGATLTMYYPGGASVTHSSNPSSNNATGTAPSAANIRNFQQAVTQYQHQQRMQQAAHLQQQILQQQQQQQQQQRNIHPQFRSKSVCVLSCRHCIKTVCNRGMKAILLADTRVELYSTDCPPRGVQLIAEDYTTANCRCKIRDVACLTCGNVVGYHVTQPCNDCLDSCNNGHFWMFHSDAVDSSDRQDSTGSQTLLWANLPGVDLDIENRDIYDLSCR